MDKLKNNIIELADLSNKQSILTNTNKLKKEINISFRNIFDINSDQEGLPIIQGPFKGGTDPIIENKLRLLYSKPDPNKEHNKTTAWNVSVNGTHLEYFYIQNKICTEIIGAVGILYYIDTTDYGELCNSFVDPMFQNLGLWTLLVKARLEYVRNKNDRNYILYTEFEHLRDIHIKEGMILLSPKKEFEPVRNKFFWNLILKKR